VRERGCGPVSTTEIDLPGRTVSDDMHGRQTAVVGERLGDLLRRRTAGFEQHRFNVVPQLGEDSFDIAYGRINEKDFGFRRHDEPPGRLYRRFEMFPIF
jgi:hypothetical protein